MRSIVIGFVFGVAMFAIGWLVATSTTAPQPQPFLSAAGAPEFDSKELFARLDRLEAALAGIRAPDVASQSPTRESVKSAEDATADLLRSIDKKLDEMLSSSALASSSLVEVSMARPLPDNAALTRLQKAVATDPSLLKRLTGGMSYRDATIAFGTPTKKISSTDQAVGKWIWDFPAADCVLVIRLVGGYASSAYFAPRRELDEK